MTTPTTTDPAAERERWLAELLALVEALETAGDRLRRYPPPPPGGADGGRLAFLLGALDRLGVDADRVDPPGTRADLFRQRVRITTRSIEDRLQNVLEQVDHEARRLVAAGAQPAGRPRLIRTDDFDGGRSTMVHERHGPLALATVAVLPAGHWVRDLVPPSGLYGDGGTFGGALVLGRPQRGWDGYVLKPFYDSARSVEWTRLLRAEQDEQAEDRRRAKEAADEREKRELERDPAHRLKRVEAELAALKSRQGGG
jgi:hypothetical protein